ncbi:methyl-accepting chemotaxis protein [Roseovarius atlanticus]|uniref:methyl-accepting chemotaxis protein n=1 Tax=Roseovarius atlanticus TaxID=1641875 RepID=UPI001C98733A|nr:methyl-accepting chemotaxis protein [Roseovarius atlanticus]MBY5990259.1 nitrate- and nitrite sensing domain-containing protein [Roseovarius atlanticus]MBY6126805.1 nitrate- and nitrite sensing domain-containing protein [Roseovarius atlanticus]MBY6151298.1 nitrate- and nitrite sensing domain-containing protein [Roseovarius atlanticus]
MRLRVVMFLVIAPLFAAVGYLTSVEVAQKRADAGQAETSRILAHESAIVGALVHELQKERGFSAGLIASRGANFRSDLAQQRTDSDAAIAAFAAEVSALRRARVSEIARVNTRLDQLEDMRKQVDAFGLAVPDMAAFYTETITHLLELERPVAARTTRGETNALLEARTLLSAAKEAAGLERAMGATGLGSGFRPAVFNRYLRLNGAQEALLTEAAGTLEDPEWLARIRASDAFSTIRSARDRILAGSRTRNFDGLTAPEWFAISTAWIDLLRAEELKLFEAVRVKSAEIEATADTTLKRFAIFGAVLAVSVLAFAVFAFERMIARIKYLISVINKFTGGDFSVYIDGIDSKDELGQMASAIFRFKQETIEMRKGAEALKADQERIKAEQDQVVTALRDGLNRLSDGDLAQRFDAPFPQEYESLRHDFNTTVSRLNDALCKVVDATRSIRSGSGALERSSGDLSFKAEEQAQNVRNTADAVKEVTSSVRAASLGAGEVQQTTQAAKNAALESDPVVRQAVDAMEEISGSSEQIAQIIVLIEDIAFQTNLLALNAGVEAARAGDAGRGFAVVASEVRALAQRSTEAAMQIKTLIGNSSLQVKNGVELVNEAGTALKSILERVAQIDKLVADMANATEEQASELENINTTVTRVDSVTQETATMAAEARTTCEDLNTYAGHLEQLVGQFSLTRPERDGMASAA